MTRRRNMMAASFALALMLLFIALPPVQRTQEARVLETAREMMHADFHRWLIPRLNGQIRLEKPPLAYWLAAGAFHIGSVSEGAGRIPFALAGWGTILITFATARRLFDEHTALFSAAALLGFLMFARHALLAETDVLATLFVTAAIACLLRSTQKSFLLSGVMAGLAVLAKGLPALFALAFLAGFVALRWREDRALLWRWLRSGAPIALVVIAAPWFIYVHRTVGLSKLTDEAEIGFRGAKHAASFLQYFPDLLRAVLPLSGVTVLAIALAIKESRHDRRLLELLLWFASIFIPLLVAGQRQFHYLLPALPPLAILTGWCLTRHRELPLLRAIVTWTIAVAALAALLNPFLTPYFFLRGHRLAIDWLICACIASGWLTVLFSQRDRVSDFAFFPMIMSILLTQVWMPTLRPTSPREVAQQIRSIGYGPYFFYGENISIPLVFYLRTIVPQLQSPPQLLVVAEKQRSMIVIAQTKSGQSPPPVPDAFERIREIRSDDQTFEIYRLRAR